MKKRISSSFVLLLMFSCFLAGSKEMNAQNFTGFNSWKNLIEYEGQRFLMFDIFDLNAEDVDRLKLTKSIQEIDSDEGFMIVFTSYKFNANSGLVITAFNSQNHVNSDFGFVNINLSQGEVMGLHQEILRRAQDIGLEDVHDIIKFNDRITIDIHCVMESQSYGEKYYDIILWIDGHTRHNFTKAKWDRAMKKHQSFLETAFLE